MINAPFSFILLVTGAYLSGAIPFSLLIAKAKGIDLTSIGSGNFGATNVYRALGFKYALGVFMLDALKGAIPMFVGQLLFESPVIQVIVGFTAIFGHVFSLFLGFKGGKGAATSLGVFFVFLPVSMAITVGISIVVLLLFRMVSLATLTACIVLPVVMVLFGEPKVTVYLVSIMSFFIVLKHRSNIQRLIKGTENKI